jgi:hypothetical protein
MRRKLGDRRNRPRYDIVGDLWGTLETVVRLPLKNLGPGGALIESHVPLLPQSVHRLTFDCDGQDATTQVRVRHVSRADGADGERTFLIGVEFLSVHPVLADHIAERMADSHDDTAAGADV